MGPLVVFLPGVAASIHYVPCEQVVANETLLKVCLSRLRALQADREIILVHEGAPSEVVQCGATMHGCRLLECRGRSETAVLQAVAESIHADVVVSGLLEMSLAPASLAARHWEWHQTAGLDYSVVVDVPERVSAEIVSLRALRILMSLNVPGAPARLRTFLQGIERAGGTTQLGVQLATRYFGARSVFPCQSGDLPMEVAFETPDDLECAWVALAEDGQSEDEWAMLRSWKRQRISKLTSAKGQRRPSPRRTSAANVLFVSNASACSGAEESLTEVVKHLDRRRYVPAAIVALDGEFVDRLRAAGSEVFVPNQDFGGDRLDSYRLLVRTIEACRPDVIHVNAPSGMPLIYAAWERGIPLVPHVRQAELQSWSPLLQAAERVIAVSNFIKKRVTEQDVEQSRIHVVYDGVDPDRFAPGLIDRSEARLCFGLAPDSVVLLCVARYARAKRLDLFCRVVAKLREEWPSTQALIVGDPQAGPDVAAEVAELVQNLGITASVKCVGFQRDIRYSLAAADVIVLCSEREPLGTCVLEAFAMGIPAVVTHSGGLAELIEAYGAGVLVPTGNVEALRDGIRAVLLSDELRDRVRRGGQRAIQSECNSSAASTRMMEIFDSALAG